MAIDKVVDSAFLDGGLKKIADAIREKSGSADALAFPDAMEAAVKAIDGGGVQSDLSQNDPTKADYVKNRTHYIETGEVVVEHVDTDADTLLDNFPKFAVGDTVTVTVDGSEHTLVSFEDYGTPAIGDPSDDVFDGIGELGWCIYEWEGSVFFLALEQHTIRYEGEAVHKIDNKYIPVLPQNRIENGRHLCFDISSLVESREFVDTLRNGATIYSIDPSISFYKLPRIGLGYIRAPAVAFVTNEGSYFIEYEFTEFPGYSTIKGQFYVFVHADAVEEGIEEYKEVRGIE